ncbi:MAG: pyridoxal phosphate-dependent aminotransferase [Candidatus Caldatribacteriaceae bacterium]
MSFNPHGGRRLELEKSGKKVVLDLSANLNPWGPPEVLRRRWEELWSFVEPYPPLDLSFLQERIALLYRFPPSIILPTNGATQAIYLLARVLPGKRILILEPCFTEYRRAFSLFGKKVFSFPFFPRYDFAELLEYIITNAIDVLVLGNPSNPLGETQGASLYHYLRSKALGKALIFVVDEAFQEFVGERTSLVSRVTEDPRLYIVRSLTKYYALAGLRGGFVISCVENVRFLETQVEPWSINGILFGALEVLVQEDLFDFHHQTREKLLKEKIFLEENFKRWGEILTFYPSEVNFYTLRVKKDAETFFAFLWDKGFLVRRLSDFFGLGREFFRIAVRRQEENQIFCEAVEQFGRKI